MRAAPSGAPRGPAEVYGECAQRQAWERDEEASEPHTSSGQPVGAREEAWPSWAQAARWTARGRARRDVNRRRSGSGQVGLSAPLPCLSETTRESCWGLGLGVAAVSGTAPVCVLGGPLSRRPASLLLSRRQWFRVRKRAPRRSCAMAVQRSAILADTHGCQPAPDAP